MAPPPPHQPLPSLDRCSLLPACQPALLPRLLLQYSLQLLHLRLPRVPPWLRPLPRLRLLLLLRPPQRLRLLQRLRLQPLCLLLLHLPLRQHLLLLLLPLRHHLLPQLPPLQLLCLLPRRDLRLPLHLPLLAQRFQPLAPHHLLPRPRLPLPLQCHQ